MSRGPTPSEAASIIAYECRFRVFYDEVIKVFKKHFGSDCISYVVGGSFQISSEAEYAYVNGFINKTMFKALELVKNRCVQEHKERNKCEGEGDPECKE